MLELGLSLIWQSAFFAALFLIVLAILAFAYPDKRWLRFLVPFGLCELFLLFPGSYRYEWAEGTLDAVTYSFLAVTVVLSIWIAFLAKPNRPSAAFLALLLIAYAILAAAFVVVTDS